LLTLLALLTLLTLLDVSESKTACLLEFAGGKCGGAFTLIPAFKQAMAGALAFLY
jgi:hypothetical protein